VLARSGSQGVLEGELIPRGEFGDNLVVPPWNGTLWGHRSDISVGWEPEIVLWGGRGDGRGMPNGYAHRLPGTFRPRPVVLEAGCHVVGVRWQSVVEGDGRGWAAVKGAGEVDVLGVLVQHLVVSAGSEGGGRGGTGRVELGKGGVVN
jgi:hypothetical protein